jgi:hypothetical protein
MRFFHKNGLQLIPNYKIMPRPKGSQNKITSEVKDKLQLLIDDLIASLDVNELDVNQRIKMLQIVLQYTLPRMKQATNEVSEDLPLFIE